MPAVICFIAVALLLSGCFRTDSARDEHRRSRDTLLLSGTVAGMPVELHAETRHQELTRIDEHRDTNLPALDAVLGPLAHSAHAAISPVASAITATGNGLAGAMTTAATGLGGLGTAAFAFWRGRRRLRQRDQDHDQSLGRLVTGIERAKAALPPTSIDALHTALAKNLDSIDKAAIRRIKASAI